MTDRERIEQACQEHGLTVQSWDEEAEDGLMAKLGRYVVLADDDDEGLCSGDEGELVAQVVGSSQYGNQRVWFGMFFEGREGANEIRDLLDIEPV